jgi:periplasmic protein TonB
MNEGLISTLKRNTMEKDLKRIPAFDDIVFEFRNKEYGAYVLRHRYNNTLIVASLISTIIMGTAIIAPYLNSKASENRERLKERQVEIKLENFDQPNQQVAPPPLPPPENDIVQQQKYVPPQVVDSIKPEDMKQLMTADQAQTEVTNKEVVEAIQQVKEEVQEAEHEPEPFIVVEEMPVFPGGESGLLKYIAENTKYPEIAKENNMQGKVVVKFCVTSKGGVDLVSIYKGVDPELDAEAIRVVKSLPLFKPGKQGGKPVPVWFSVPITFQIK